MPLALAVVSLAWAYGLFVIVLSLDASSRADQIGDVSLARGIVESIDQHSQDSFEIELLVRNDRQRFTAPKEAVGQLARSDSVIFAYMRQSKEIIRMATIDTSTPDRIILEGRQ